MILSVLLSGDCPSYFLFVTLCLLYFLGNWLCCFLSVLLSVLLPSLLLSG